MTELRQLLKTMMPVVLRLTPAFACVLYLTAHNSGLLGTAEYQSVARTLLSGQRHYGFYEFDARSFERLMARGNAGRQLSALVVGSSRVMELDGRCFDGAYYNAAVPGATLEDIGAVLHEFLAGGRRLDRLVISADPWMLNGAVRGEAWNAGWYPVAGDWLAAKTGAGLLPGPRDVGRTAMSLFAPLGELLSPVAAHTAWQIVRGERELPGKDPKQWFLRQPDGSMTLPEFVTSRSAAEAARIAATDADFHIRTVYRGFERIDPEMAREFEAITAHAAVASAGRVTLFLHPLHPVYSDKVRQSPAGAMVGEAEEFYRRLAAAHGWEIVGTYDAARAGVSAGGFYDGVHLRKGLLQSLFGCPVSGTISGEWQSKSGN